MTNMLIGKLNELMNFIKNSNNDDMEREKKSKKSNDLNFTCEEVDFVDYETLKIFFGDLEEVDNIQVRKQTNIPEIDLNAVTKWEE